MTNEEAKRIAQGLITDFKCESETMVDFCTTVIKALEQTRWIPVSKRLPEDNTRVLVTMYDTYDEKVIITRYQDKEHGFLCGLVKAWQPLPEQYKAESEG